MGNKPSIAPSRDQRTSDSTEPTGWRSPASAFAVAALPYAWWATSLAPFGWSATGAVVAVGLILIVIARLVRRPRPRTSDPRVTPRNVAVWIAIAIALCAWELLALFSHPRASYPTISSLIDPLQRVHVIRWLLFCAWLRIGWGLAT